MSNNASMYYIGTLPCGCISTVSEDIPGFETVTGKEVQHMIEKGLKIQRVNWDHLNLNWAECPHESPVTKQAKQLAFAC